MEEEDALPSAGSLVDDLLENPAALPAIPPSFIAAKYRRGFATDVGGVARHDYYVWAIPNGLCVVGLAPSHPLISSWRSREAANALPSSAALGLQAAAGQTAGAAAKRQRTDHEGAAPDAPQPENEPQQEQQQQHPAAPVEGEQEQQPAPTGTHSRGVQSQQGAGNVEYFPPDQLAAVDFDIGKRTASQKQSGKRRGQGSLLDAGSILAKLVSNTGTSMSIKAVVPGKLLEVNQRLVSQPQLLLDRPCREGYLAILFPMDYQLAALKSSLMPVHQYLQLRELTEDDLL